ncbi:MAG: hypothetical protein HY222_03120 [Thaumarchaeota archaeon]|nr:hypothetical protein [Nitrososphaerota archaeon]MBI3641366.1 hypothetical protein [Nitrososphaerota archaeon]
MIQRVTHELRKAKSDSEFNPSMKILSRIMKVLLDINSIQRTTMSLETNIQYSRLSRHLEWLERKRLIESFVEEGKIFLKLTSLGREFASAVYLL